MKKVFLTMLVLSLVACAGVQVRDKERQPNQVTGDIDRGSSAANNWGDASVVASSNPRLNKQAFTLTANGVYIEKPRVYVGDQYGFVSCKSDNHGICRFFGYKYAVSATKDCKGWKMVGSESTAVYTINAAGEIVDSDGSDFSYRAITCGN